MTVLSIFDWIILVINLVISIWNAYASGYNIGLLKKYNVEGIQKAFAYSGLGLAFAGISYVLMIILSYIAYSLGYITLYTLAFLFSFNFLVFGLLIIFFGIMITIQSIYVAIKEHNIWNILAAIYNSFATIYDIYVYISSFQYAYNIVSNFASNDRDNNNVAIFVIIFLALFIGYLITYQAYRHGYNKALGINIETSFKSSAVEA